MTEFSLLMGNINRQMIQLESTFDELRRKVEHFLREVPRVLAPVIEPIKRAWDKFCEQCKKLWKEVSDFFSDRGDPGRLHDAAKTLSDKVQAGVSAQAGKFTETYMHVDDKWKGDAAEAYKKVLKPDAPQSSALRQYASTVLEVSKALNSCRWALIIFWIAFGTALAILIGEVVAAIAGLVSIAGTLPAILYTVGIIGQFLLSVAAAAAYAISEMSDAASTFRTQNNGNDHLPAGKWPPSGVAAW
ncbi:hypothetical protein Ssi03_53670 [Sphaerisporangium siamense]|uniref:Uncharacterized protein YukE n=1 Tax=Sphaerisporangium siamense TaxID=795645 RepID=A0A7W7D8F2_9ACTN|nr:hypothetical protein [Sphaerisporangium siamense]MBB4701255.1 uncharacterized protein YukE [Sphaerisporangium siamense]GII87377.1 hypothetical protein Ssi03_53670 [Sphaerisporangium siamense]